MLAQANTTTIQHPIRVRSFAALLALSLVLVVGHGGTARGGVAHAQSPEPGTLEPATAEPASTTRRARTLLDYVSDGGLIGHSIIVCSIVGVSLSITYAFQIRREVLVPPALLAQLEQLLEAEELEEADQACAAYPSFLARVVAAGLRRSGEGYPAMEAAMQEAGEAEATRLQVKISHVSLIAAIAPLLGLFGTVSGMITTFDVIALANVQPRPSELAQGISEALVTTYEGLVVAIPMIILFNVFRNRLTTLLIEVSGLVEELMERFRTLPGEAT